MELSRNIRRALVLKTKRDRIISLHLKQSIPPRYLSQPGARLTVCALSADKADIDHYVWGNPKVVDGNPRVGFAWLMNSRKLGIVL